MMNKLSQEAFQAAKSFIEDKARTVDIALFRHEFENGEPGAVEDALSVYQNDDGGFGHGIEPDFRTPASTPIATTVGLQHASEAGLTAESPVVQGAIRYLAETFDAMIPGWPLVTPAMDDAPHAPWWNYAHEGMHRGEDPAEWGNPNAEIAGYLLDYPTLVPDGLTGTVLELVAENILSQPVNDIQMYVLLCYGRLLEHPGLPDRGRMLDKALSATRAAVDHTPEAWSGHSFKPLWAAPTPASPLAPAVEDVIDANLDYEIEEQRADGSWLPNWNWGGHYPEAWEQASVEWAGRLTTATLRSLRAYGRIEGI
ncbi:MAG: hypothetical protein WD208_09520 [Dehalococcoidia bacterium]